MPRLKFHGLHKLKAVEEATGTADFSIPCISTLSLRHATSNYSTCAHLYTKRTFT